MTIPKKIAKKDGNNNNDIGIKNLNSLSNVNAIDIQYKLPKKYPKPNIQPVLKWKNLFSFLVFIKKIKNKDKVIKFKKKKLYGGKLNELTKPKRDK